ncbi:MAG: hypothetical protein P4L40_02050 [Terracidiphilus sp.]|nr:hypothetical protein [Terracidiphilus sp.]
MCVRVCVCVCVCVCSPQHNILKGGLRSLMFMGSFATTMALLVSAARQ